MKCLQRGTIIVALGGLLLACGQKGPLVLPDAPKHKRSVPPLSSPAKPNNNGGAQAPIAPPIAEPPSGAPAPTPVAPSHAPASSFNGAASTSLTARS